MIKYNISILFLVCFILSFSANAQSRKNIKEKGIKSVTAHDYYSNGNKQDKVLDSYVKYDKKGNVVEEIDYDKEGNIRDWIVNTYDEDNNKISVVSKDEKGSVIKTIKYTYKDDLKTSRLIYKKGKLVSKRVYSYEFDN